MSLLYIGQQFTIYVGFFFLCIGLFGNSMNIFIFSSIKNYRLTPCTFYFLISSIFNNLYIIINLTSRIASIGYGIDTTNTSIIWCKTRQFFVITLGAITLTCSCLATIDQYLISSKNIRLRQLSNIKIAHRLIFIIIIFWSLHGIPCFILFYLHPLFKYCTIINTTYFLYLTIFIFIYLCFVPIFIMILFGCLIFHNIQQTILLAEQHADRQSIRMILIQILLVMISNIPFGVFGVYGFITSYTPKDRDRLMKEELLATIFGILNYSYYVGTFYMFLISSSRFRQTVRDRLLCWRRPLQIHQSNTR